MKVENFKKVLVLAPHTDDGELGAGGTISKLIQANAEVHYAAFSTAAESLPAGFPEDTLKRELADATRRLGIKAGNLVVYNYQVRKLCFSRQEILEDLIKLRSNGNYDLVVIPSLNDIHQDHKTIAEEGLRAFKSTTIFSYELVWNNLNFNTAAFVKLNETQLRAKCDALKAYASQQGKPYMKEDFIFALAKTRGVQIGCAFAEAFEVVRLVL